MLNLEIPYDPGLPLSISVRRKSDRHPFDFATGAFLNPGATPAGPTYPMTEGAGIFAGLYSVNYGPTPGANGWWDGDFLITVHNLGTPFQPDPPHVVIIMAVPFVNGTSSSWPVQPYFSY